MNKILLVTDLHIRPSVLDLNKTYLDFIYNQILERKPKYLGILGDTFHTKNIVHLSCTNLFQDFIEKVSKLTQVIILIGNHDWGVPYSEHPFKSYKFITNVQIVEDYYVLNNNVFISYCKEKERFLNFLELAGDGIDRIFAHMDIDGFTPGSGWEEVSPFLNPEQLNKYKQVFSGHLHLAQEKILSNGTEIVMVGSGYTTDFGESDQKKRIIELDLTTGKYESIDTGLTMHKTIRINATDPFPEIPVEEYMKGVEYRVIIKGTKEQITTLIIPKKYLARISYDIISSSGTRIELSTTDSQDDIMKKYISEELKRSFLGEEDKFDKDKLLKTGKRFIPNT